MFLVQTFLRLMRIFNINKKSINLSHLGLVKVNFFKFLESQGTFHNQSQSIFAIGTTLIHFLNITCVTCSKIHYVSFNQMSFQSNSY